MVAEAVDQNVGSIREAVTAAQVLRSVGAEPLQRVLALHPVLGQIISTLGADDHRPVRFGVDHHEANPFVICQAVQQAGIHVFDLLQCDASTQTGPIDQAQVARGQHHDLRQLVLLLSRALLFRPEFVSLGTQNHPVIVGAALQGATQRTLDRFTVVLYGFGQEDVDLFPVLVHVHVPPNLIFRGQLLDQILQRHMVALFEGSAGALAVVRQDDEMVGAGRLPGRALHTGELLVDLVQRVKGVV